ncbi:hypothetical protein LEL36_21860, partial [Salmonella enterica]|uniref:hypothetical protein n=1 Tax=Salmonella enterica TaxID=28901 RepID=UPI00297ADC8B|nr:hypothetical protein [Salmonella enterica]MDJ3941759.1 hypothetical protein [Salmonella enterica]MDJ4301824.1 hypothetical protein [Salmonella enterica]MDJ4529372.1 hypothetical protein [Salmonella enterica]MDJ4811880.1 hypothetical protein [Salmonella enterica]
RTYLYPVNLIRFAGFFGTYSFWGLNRGPHGSLRNGAPAMTLTTNTDTPAHENQQCGRIFKGQTCLR